MKHMASNAAFVLLLAGTGAVAEPVVSEKTWTETYPVTTASPTLGIDNIWGNVSVRTANVDHIEVTINERRSAPNDAMFERSMAVYFLDTHSDENSVSFQVGGTNRDWQTINQCSGCRVDFQFDVVVPPGTSLDVGTVMDGRVTLRGEFATVSASNVNGPIDVDGLANCAQIENVNGPITLGFPASPAADCSIETVNGDITLAIPPDAGLDVAVDLFNGHIVSELEVEPVSLPATVEHVADSGRNHYRLEKPASVRIGAGGPNYRISSLNGDVNIRKL